MTDGMKCEHVLVPIDFSSDSLRALYCAIGLAQQFKAKLTLLHVISLPDAQDADMADYLNKVEGELEQDLAIYQKRVEDAGVSMVHAYVGHGLPATRIVEGARFRKADLIVMGTHGRTGLQHLLIGSVAERVIRMAPCPVMVVPRKSREKEQE